MVRPAAHLRSGVALAVLACLLAAPHATAQAPRPRPNPRPSSPPSRPAEAPLPGRLLVSVDDEAMVSVDGQPSVRYKAGDVKTIPVTLGKHIVRASSTRLEGLSAQQIVETTEAAPQQVVEFTLRAAVSLTGRLTGRRQASTAERGTPVVIVVDAPLAQAAAALAASLVPLRVWLQTTTGEAIGPRAPELPALMHVELTHTAEGPAAPGATTEMQSCPVTVAMDVFRGGVPASYSFNAAGAAFSAGQACATARQRAVTSALTALTAMVRKELR